MNKPTTLFDINITRSNTSVSFDTEEDGTEITIIEGDVVLPFNNEQKEGLEIMLNRVDNDRWFVTASWFPGHGWGFNYKMEHELAPNDLPLIGAMIPDLGVRQLSGEAETLLAPERYWEMWGDNDE